MSFPLDPTKHDSHGVVSPTVLAQHSAATGAYASVPPPTAAILCYHRGLADQLLTTRPARTIRGFFGDTHLLESTNGEIALVSDFGIGAPAAAVMLEDLVALGCRRIVSVGTCGGMAPHLAPGDLVLVDRAVRDEGTSHHYAPADLPALPDSQLTAAIAGELDARDTAHHRTATWTTDAIYRETAAEVRAHVAAGVDVVEMEAAALFVIAEVRAAQVASLLVVSDTISTLDGSWMPEFHGDVVGAALERAFDVALAVLA
ncbi:MAG: hypothetical protein JWN41_765 [Thermoleophilia bacterium]|nr:hypothetical protein [Thermoleophilia bacterium]